MNANFVEILFGQSADLSGVDQLTRTAEKVDPRMFLRELERDQLLRTPNSCCQTAQTLSGVALESPDQGP